MHADHGLRLKGTDVYVKGDVARVYAKGVHKNLKGATVTAKGGSFIVPTDGPDSVYVPDCVNCFTSLGIAAPSHLYLCQDVGGNLLDEIGGIMLTANGSPLYSQAVAGWTRLGVGMNQAAAQRFAAPAGFGPNPATESVAWLGYFNFGTQAATRRFMGANISSGAGVAAVNVAASGILQLASPGTTQNGAIDHRGAVRAVLQIYDRTNSISRCITNLETITGIYSAAAGSSHKGLGTDGSTSMLGECVWLAAWEGAAAESLSAATLTALGW